MERAFRKVLLCVHIALFNFGEKNVLFKHAWKHLKHLSKTVLSKVRDSISVS